jgi:peroxiredoxin Q/BCP
VDAVEAQKKHAITCAADFPILSDADKSLTTQLGILNERGMASRTTYVLDSTGTVRKVFNGVTVDGHVDQVLNAVKELRGAA